MLDFLPVALEDGDRKLDNPQVPMPRLVGYIRAHSLGQQLSNRYAHNGDGCYLNYKKEMRISNSHNPN